MIHFYIRLTPPQDEYKNWHWAILWASGQDVYCEELYQVFSIGEADCAQEAMLTSVEELRRFKKEYCIK